jgi:hypothetical protein
MGLKILTPGGTAWLYLATGVLLLSLLVQMTGPARMRQANNGVAGTVQDAQAAVRAQIEALLDAAGDQSRAITAFSGTRGAMSLVAPLASAGLPALRRFSLELTKMGDVVLSCCVDLKATCACPHLPHAGDAILLRDVSGLELAYYDADPLDPVGGAWRDSWFGPLPPSLIRLRVTFPLSDARWWPDLIIETSIRPISARPVAASPRSCAGCV